MVDGDTGVLDVPPKTSEPVREGLRDGCELESVSEAAKDRDDTKEKEADPGPLVLPGSRVVSASEVKGSSLDVMTEIVKDDLLLEPTVLEEWVG